MCFQGADTFTYMVSDGNDGTDTATVTIHVGGTETGVHLTDGTLYIVGTDGKDIITVTRSWRRLGWRHAG